MRLLRALKNILRIKAEKSDVARWGQEENLHDSWDDRTRILAGYVREGERVIDFGAGKMRLRDFLPAGCTYTPVDMVAREEGMLTADLNQLPLPDVGCHDVAVFSGVMEYLHDVPAVVEAIKPVASRVIVSYTILENKQSVMRRRANAFANDYTEAQFLDLYQKNGYQLLDRAEWYQQVLFHFGKTSPD